MQFREEYSRVSLQRRLRGGEVWIRTLSTGFRYYGAVFPWVDLDHGGRLSGLRQAVELLLLEPDSTVFVPGHGSPIHKSDLQTMKRMLDESFELVGQGIAQHLSLQQIEQKGLPKEWQSWAWEGMSTSKWLDAVYADSTPQRQ